MKLRAEQIIAHDRNLRSSVVTHEVDKNIQVHDVSVSIDLSTQKANLRVPKDLPSAQKSQPQKS